MIDYSPVIKMNKRISGILSLLLATVIWGGAFVAQSAGMETIGPFTFQAVRCALAVAALFLASLVFDLRAPSAFFKKWADPALWRAGVLCGLALFAAASLQQVGIVSTSAGKSGFITALYIVIVPIIGLILQRGVSPLALASLPFAVAGMYLLCNVDAGGVNTGDVLLMLCAVCFAVQITLVDRLGPGRDPIRLNAVQALTVTVLSLPFMFFAETPTLQGIGQSWFELLFAGVLSMGLAYALQIVGQKRVEPTPAALLMSLESVFAVLFSALLLGERMSARESWGCVLMFAAVLISQLPPPRKRHK